MNEAHVKPIPIKRALLSVSDKRGLVDFARALIDLGVEIISTGGTSQLLREAKLPHREVSEITGMDEMLSGRVKTLHPNIHGGILGKRDLHAEEAVRHRIEWIDLVVVNFYPFAEVMNDKDNGLTWENVTEYIDIGGPTMVRAAAKNFAWVGVIVDPADYATVLSQIEREKGLDLDLRRKLSKKAFALTAHYDAMIHHYFLRREEADVPRLSQFDFALENYTELRYGENPHQKACAYEIPFSFQHPQKNGILSALKHQGKPLSYNNILDAEAAFLCVREFLKPASVVVKHTNPCGAASAETIEDAYERAYHADSLSAFGGVIAFNRPCTKALAESLAQVFAEVILAPAYSSEALAIFKAKPNLRVIELADLSKLLENKWEMKFITGGVLLQEIDSGVIAREDLQCVTEERPSDAAIDDMLFAWRILKHIKSNAILIARDYRTVGIGAGQVSRIDAVEVALRKASHTHLDHTILASDAFFPFRDSIDRIAQSGLRAIIQPGGSVRDDEVIAACNQHRIAMMFTGKRCFRH